MHCCAFVEEWRPAESKMHKSEQWLEKQKRKQFDSFLGLAVPPVAQVPVSAKRGTSNEDSLQKAWAVAMVREEFYLPDPLMPRVP